MVNSCLSIRYKMDFKKECEIKQETNSKLHGEYRLHNSMKLIGKSRSRSD